jgi:thioredoxin reductase
METDYHDSLIIGAGSAGLTALALGADHRDQGALVTGPSQETSVANLFAAGDVTCGLNQAATALHRRLLGFD